ncbi:MAG: hypothetical protein MZV70_42115 [Desulfobacterales bacterium]|nr:hypothetical protein [Desulfobacterales bacterium]
MKYLKTPWQWPLVWANNQDITNPAPHLPRRHRGHHP